MVPSISDHDGAIVADSDIIPAYNKKKPRKLFAWSQAKWSKIKEDVSSFTENFLNTYNDFSVNENWNRIKCCINDSLTSHVPVKISSGKQSNSWITPELRRKSRKKHRLYRKAKRTGDPARWKQFKEVQKSNKRAITKARVKYINEQVVGDLEGGNAKPFWRYIKSLRQDSFGIPALRVGAQLFTSAQDKAKVLLDEFKSVFTIEDTSFIPWLGRSTSKIPDLTVGVSGVRKLLYKLKPHKASGPDGLPNRVLKELSHELAPSLTALYNQSLSSHSLPEDWKHAFISPVYKKGDVHTPGNYRPVSLTTVACKILEHIICKHILDFLDVNTILTSAQYGFRKSHSCETQLLITLTDFYKSINSHIQVDVGILDFSRAFDTVPHERLMGKLASCGIHGPINGYVLSWQVGPCLLLWMGRARTLHGYFLVYHKEPCWVRCSFSST